MSEKPVMPRGWFVAGSHPKTYHMGIDPNTRYEQGVSACIKASESPEGFGTLMQMFNADAIGAQGYAFWQRYGRRMLNRVLLCGCG